MSVEYKKAHEKYRDLAEKSMNGDPIARKDKSKAMQDILTIERASAKDGINLNAVYKGSTVVVETTNSPTKRSLQEEYCRKFDDEKPVEINGKQTTLRKWHEKRLLGK